MTTNIEGKVFAITGGASGMGLATARELATRGAKAVCIGDFNESNFATVKTELSALNPATAVEVTKLDVSSSASVESWITSIVQKFGALDGALNAAGLPQGPAGGDVPSIITEDEAIWNRIIAVNLTGIYLSCREQVKAMINLPPGPRAIVNVSSMAPFLHQGGCMFAYGASKSGVHHLSENLASNLRKFGIRVNSVCPGLTETPMQKIFVPGDVVPGVTPGIPNTITAKDVADTVVWLLSNDSPQVSGVHIPIGEGMP